MTILAFSGSPQPGSAAGQLLHAAAAGAPAGVAFAFYEAILGLPLFSPDLDGPDAQLAPAVATLRQQLQAADAVLIATPEYASGMPGSLKNADMVFCYGANLGWDARESLAPLGDKAIVKDDLNELVAAIAAVAQSGDHVLVMSNGSFGGIQEKLLQRLAG